MYDLTKFLSSIPDRSKPFAQSLIDVAVQIPSPLITPFILCAVMERESGSGVYLVPEGPSGVGDNGHGHGLMQIDDRSFHEWLLTHQWWVPEVNIGFGANLLLQNQSFFSNSNPIPGLSDGKIITVSLEQASRRKVQAGDYTDPRPILDTTVLQKALISSYNTGRR